MHGHALPSTSATDLDVIGSNKVHQYFARLSNPYSLKCGMESEILSTLSNICLYVFHAWKNLAMFRESPVPPSDEGLPSPVNVDEVVIKLATVPDYKTSMTAGSAVQVK